MATSSSRRNGPVVRSLSPSGRFASSTSSTFSSRSSTLFHNYQTIPPHHYHNHSERSASPTRVNFRSISPSRSISSVGSPPRRNQVVKSPTATPKRTCLCSPTTHPGSFRCSLHKGYTGNSTASGGYGTSNRLNARRSAMTNSLVRIGGVEGGDLVKRALAALIRPSSHQLRRRTDFQPRPSRLSVMSKAED